MVALTWIVLPSPGVAGIVGAATDALFGPMVVTQVSGSGEPGTAPKDQAEDLLRRARQAMAENDLDAARVLVERAEGLDVDYGAFHFGDTPEKVRKDLERKAAAIGRVGVNPLRSGGEKLDPFAGRNADRAGGPRGVQQPAGRFGADPTKPTPLPPVGPNVSGRRGASRLGGQGALQSALAGTRSGRSSHPQRANSDSMILEARRALALGDVRRAENLAKQAKALNVPYALQDDTPDKVLSAIKRYSDLTSEREDRKRTEGYRRQLARIFMDQSEALLRWGEFDEAERLADQAARQQVTFGPYDAKPQELLQRIASARRNARRGGSGVVQAGGQEVITAGGQVVGGRGASHALYDQSNDPTRNVPANNLRLSGPRSAGHYDLAQNQPTPAPPRTMPGGEQGKPADAGKSRAMQLFEQGEAALRARDVQRAIDLFRQAAQRRNELDPMTAQRLQDHLQLLSAGGPSGGGAPANNIANQAAAEQQVLARQLATEIAHQASKARRMQESDPKGAIALMEETRQKVEQSRLEPGAKEQLLRRADRSIRELKTYLAANGPKIELEEKNEKIRGEVERSRQVKLEVQEKLALMVDEFNRLMDEQRFSEAEVVAKRAAELDPENPVVQQLTYQAKFVRRLFNNMAVRDAKEQGFIDQLASVDESSIPFDDRNPIAFPKFWGELTKTRARLAAERGQRRSERELEIEQKLKTPVSLQFQNAPLTEVLDYLARLAEVNLHLDPQGLAEEGVTTDTPVTINLSQEISLKSALNLILQPLHLSYVIKDEVLKITSEQLRDGEVYTVTYNVADLVVPIPNFVPSTRMGLSGALHDALGSVGFDGGNGFAGASSPLAVVASHDGSESSARINPNVLAQMGGRPGSPSMGPASMPTGFGGPGGLGGGAQADFDSLMELIVTTIKPESWTEVGGAGSIAPFETNLSLVVSQTQEVHEEIADLLEQLRRLQDLQVTIEVRFITLNDNFFERIGVDFDFDIDDDIDRPFQIFGRQIDDGTTGDDDDDLQEPTRDTRDVDHDRSVTVGMSSPGVFSADLDIPFTQNSFGLAVPQFGGFDAQAGAQLGFAIISDIEAFFFINAAQGDRRTNVLQAPKVTLFNGQQAFVSDTSQSPFVISVIPVVGDFAAAQQPVIVVLSEGTFLTVQAVISNDRRFVRLTVVPFFSEIGDDVDTFTFQGSETTTQDTSTEGDQENPNDNTKASESSTVTTEGTTVQLPTFSFITVTTTVSVPDGGTVLLGGTKRLNEGRSEFGVPMLNKIPYINRLFKNVGIGRETQSLMMMVTPRIIIQEEEEERLGIQP
jgi:general secretion pathway protein D